jgi:hypothetical protein
MPSDVAFSLFMATVTYEDLSPYERRLWKHNLHHPGHIFDPRIDDQIASYAREKRKAA